MRKRIKTILAIIICIFVLYLLWIYVIWYLINNWYTNAESTSIEIVEEKKYYLPEDVINSQCVQFVLNWIDNRKTFNTALIETSKDLWLDYNIVISAILWEQIRISCKGVRGNLKSIILYGTPTLFRSNNVSVGIAGIKLNTAFKIKRDAINYGYWDKIKNIGVSEEILTKNDRVSWIYATYLVQNIIYRWWIEWYDISMNAWVVGTLYNMGNREDKIPHEDPKIWWAIITIEWQQFTYWEISLWVYNYLTSKKTND